jgi:hypothetical protein
VILDVGRMGWFYVRWTDGTTEEQNKKDLDVYKDRPTAESFGPRLFPLEYGGDDSHHF